MRCDTSGVSVGRRYARADELGIPFAITIDFDSLSDQMVTLRERDSKSQIRISVNEIASVVSSLAVQSTSWTYISQKYKLIGCSETISNKTKVEENFSFTFCRPKDEINTSELKFSS
mmetsp:Transcript_2343/g.3353  ORF Transcript_2343/g.3353 Transcript_2343/m.3353 type:complete len:117 (+) Transcript_2343:1933-2283(+)